MASLWLPCRERIYYRRWHSDPTHSRFSLCLPSQCLYMSLGHLQCPHSTSSPSSGPPLCPRPPALSGGISSLSSGLSRPGPATPRQRRRSSEVSQTGCWSYSAPSLAGYSILVLSVDSQDCTAVTPQAGLVQAGSVFVLLPADISQLRLLSTTQCRTTCCNTALCKHQNHRVSMYSSHSAREES